MAPEIYKDEKYGYGVDMWALGVTIYFMLNSEYPFSNLAFYVRSRPQKINPRYPSQTPLLLLLNGQTFPPKDHGELQ